MSKVDQCECGRGLESRQEILAGKCFRCGAPMGRSECEGRVRMLIDEFKGDRQDLVEALCKVLRDEINRNDQQNHEHFIGAYGYEGKWEQDPGTEEEVYLRFKRVLRGR